MGYQESLVYVRPQRRFDKLIRAYEKAEQSGYYSLVGAQPRSVIVLKHALGSIPSGSKLLWVCGDRCFHSVGGIFGGNLHGAPGLQIIPVESVFDSPGEDRKSVV